MCTSCSHFLQWCNVYKIISLIPIWALTSRIKFEELSYNQLPKKLVRKSMKRNSDTNVFVIHICYSCNNNARKSQAHIDCKCNMKNNGVTRSTVKINDPLARWMFRRFHLFSSELNLLCVVELKKNGENEEINALEKKNNPKFDKKKCNRPDLFVKRCS